MTYMPSSLWLNQKFRALTMPAQHLLLHAYTSPLTNQAGVLDWRPARIAAHTTGLDAKDIEHAGAELQSTGWLIVDEETEEAGILSWFCTTIVIKQPMVMQNALKLVEETASTKVRQALINQIHEMDQVEPPLNGLQTEHAREFLAMYPEK
ncbi:hypothetical protein C3E79_10285 [Corynebacterium liangguodongii]|uniref:Uncharacterized protein n=2 Tax=Corynebacterium liangguodongii TaxID=2079535 RepID=A0A2S0WGA8_9CORY|nr:hypothetical protein C3E79_10285 [Corynebacterium liangguodongii]PWB99172.1 hypothetical protein DF219_07900 [Corynebacterium liangguodongii]